jgi:hypothetical protein
MNTQTKWLDEKHNTETKREIQDMPAQSMSFFPEIEPSIIDQAQ